MQAWELVCREREEDGGPVFKTCLTHAYRVLMWLCHTQMIQMMGLTHSHKGFPESYMNVTMHARMWVTWVL